MRQPSLFLVSPNGGIIVYLLNTTSPLIVWNTYLVKVVPNPTAVRKVNKEIAVLILSQSFWRKTLMFETSLLFEKEKFVFRFFFLFHFVSCQKYVTQWYDFSPYFKLWLRVFRWVRLKFLIHFNIRTYFF